MCVHVRDPVSAEVRRHIHFDPRAYAENDQVRWLGGPSGKMEGYCTNCMVEESLLTSIGFT